MILMKRRNSPDIYELINSYELAKRAEGKSPKTVKSYHELLFTFCRYIEENVGYATLSHFTINTFREYVIHLRSRLKFQGHPHIPPGNGGLSIESVRDHVRTLKTFASWLHVEKYTRENRLTNLKLPKPEGKIIEPLSDDEITIVLNSIDQKTQVGRRNHTILVLMLDTGLREGDVAGAELANFNPVEGSLKVKGKGSKQRIVPVGMEAQREISDYITGIRFRIAKPDCTRLFVSESGGPITENAIKLFFTRLK
jgi:integrase/recombinase XerD